MRKTAFVASQERILRAILKKNRKASLFKHFGLDKLGRVSSFDDLYDHYKHQVPLFSYRSYIDSLQRMTGKTGAKPFVLFQQSRMVSTEAHKGYATTTKGVMPLGDAQLKGIVSFEKKIVDLLKKHNRIGNGKVFHIFENQAFEIVDDVPVGSLGAVCNRVRGYFWRKRFFPLTEDMKSVGRSRYQTLHWFIDLLEKYGDQVEVLYVKPRTLAQLGLLLAQREGRFVPLRQLLPNLRVLMTYGVPITAYKQEISFFLKGLEPQIMEIMINATGALAYQDDLNIRGRLRLCDDADVFYEFIPEDDFANPSALLSTKFKRLHAGKVEEGKCYAMVVSNSAGLLGFSTGDVVRIVSKDPFCIQYMHPVERLNHFNERISREHVERIIAQLNDVISGKGVFVREFMLGDDIEVKHARWILELSRPVKDVQEQILQMIANRLHTELMMHNPDYAQAIRLGHCKPPEMTFVSMGTFANLPEKMSLRSFDFSGDAAKVKDIIAQAWGRKTVQAKNL